MDHEILARQLIRALRGRRSQVALSRRMKCKSNVVYTWESGRRAPTAAVFFQLAARIGLDVAGSVGRFLGTIPDDLRGRDYSEPATVATLLRHLREGTTLVELARRVGTNRVSIARFLKGEAEPRLPDFLRLVDATSLRLLDFVAGFVSPAALPEAQAAWEILEAQRKVAYGLPWSHAVLRVLELDAYRRLESHRAGWIAEHLGIEQSEEERCLEALADSRVIARRRGRWVVARVLTVDTRHNPDAGRTLKRHWAEVGLARLPLLEQNENDLFSYNLFTVSELDWKRLRDLHIAYYQELRRIIEASEPAERVALVNLQLLRLDEPAPRH
jgi:transcriptional regulator with XRE-family HTH domain